jgi:phosphoenolpyruvate-protein phosphotransferase
MFKLEPQTVSLGASPRDKESAIRQAGSLLVNAGYIEPQYVESMMLRELEANTYLGNGIAIPHGVLKDKDRILKTGISVLQIPGGVEWNNNEKVHLVVGIAARSDEHLTVLANLTDILSQPELVQRLSTTSNVQDIVSSLNGTAPGDAETPAPFPAQSMIASSVTALVPGTAGLHARPATALANLARQFQSEIIVQSGQKTADGKSLISLLKLGAKGGATLQIFASGNDASAALAALKAAVDSGLGEDEAHQADQKPAVTFTWQPQTRLTGIQGISASPGLVIGPVYQLKRQHLSLQERAKDPTVETHQFNAALEGARVQLEDLYKEVSLKFGEAKAAIFRAHQEFLADPELIAQVQVRIAEGYTAAWAWNSLIEQRVDEIKKLDDPLLANRAVDLSDVGLRVLRFLGVIQDEPGLQLPATPVILIAEDLTPSDTANLDASLVLGFCTASGGPTSHSAIIARSLDIPAIVGAGPALLNLPNGTPAILDGESGTLYLDPTASDIASARQVQKDIETVREAERLACYEPAILLDGYRVEVSANINHPADTVKAVNAGAEGIGLFRTEFLFLDRNQTPTEEEQFQAYVETVKALNGLPAIIRTLDIGGDKKAPYLNLPAEDNSFLGIRGIRLCLERPDLFIPQLRAIYRAAEYGPIRMMFPMISTLEDVRAAKKIAEQVRQELNAPPVEIGIMVEVPSSVIMAPEFAQEVDFFSIGTNDLTQYTLAMDRLHPVLAKQADGLHPAVLRMVDMVVKAASAHGKWVGVCGGIAGDPKGAIILTGLGVTELSVTIPSVAAIKATLRRVSREQAQALAKRAMACRTATEVRSL